MWCAGPSLRSKLAHVFALLRTYQNKVQVMNATAAAEATSQAPAKGVPPTTCTDMAPPAPPCVAQSPITQAAHSLSQCRRPAAASAAMSAESASGNSHDVNQQVTTSVALLFELLMV